MKSFRVESIIFENPLGELNGQIGIAGSSFFFKEASLDELKFGGLTKHDLEKEDCRHYKLLKEDRSRIRITTLD